MTSMDKRPGDTAELRRRAEAIAREKGTQSPEDLDALSPERIRLTLHELRVHQIELEMQNEELRRTQFELDTARARYFDLYDLAPVGYCTLSEEGLILEANLTATTLLGVTRGALVKQPITRFILKEDQNIFYLYREMLFKAGEPQTCELRMLRKEGKAFWVRLEAGVAQDADGAPVCRLVMSDITEMKKVQQALQVAFDQIKTLHGIIPICMHCKKIRDGEGYWNRVEAYVSDHTEAEFTHGICPECLKKLYPEFPKNEEA